MIPPNTRTRWLLAVNLLLIFTVVGIQLKGRLAPKSPAVARAQTLNEQIGFTRSDSDVMNGQDVDALIDLAERTLTSMPPAAVRDGKWETRVVTILLRLSTEKNLSVDKKARMADLAKRLIEQTGSAGRSESTIDGLRWLAAVGRRKDTAALATPLTSSNPEVQATATKTAEVLARASS